MTIERWDPFDEMLSLREAMNRLIEESFVGPSMTRQAGGRAGFPIDLRESENEFVLEAALPGFKPEDIDITVQGNEIVISGVRRQEAEQRGERYHLRERSFGKFQRRLALPVNVQADQVSCELRDGILSLTLPKAEEARPRRIQVSSGGQGRQIEGQTRAAGSTDQGEQPA